ncbi:MAG TPA: response regulator [Coleofasciculaceae cyanobacterium]|jgi:CheY-like chemotaxis protein
MENIESIDANWNSALAEMMSLMGLEIPEDGISPELLQQANQKLKGLLESQSEIEDVEDQQEALENPGASSPQLNLANVTKLTPQRLNGRHRNVLITGQLGIIVHQLRQVITKQGGEVTIAKDIDEAILQYQKKDYSLVIIDLFMPTEREGLIVLEEIKRLSSACQIPTQVMVLAPQSKDNSIKERCKGKGAAFFLEKMEGWHKTILQYYHGEIPADQFESA